MVTGGAGFIGSHLVDRIIKEEPEKVIIIDNFFLGKVRNIEQALKRENVKLYYQDASHYEKMLNIFEMESVDVVFNLAVVPLLTSHELPKITCEDNINITLTMLELLRKERYNVLVHCSSSEAYGTAQKFPMDEKHPMNPTTPYAASKAACDLLVKSYENTFGVETSIVRPFNTYGPRQNEGSYSGVIPTTIGRIMSGKAPIVHGDGLQTRDFIFVGDVVEGMIKIYEHKNTRGRIINLARGNEIPILRMIETISKEMNYKGKFIFQKARKSDVRRHMGDASLARELIGFKPVTSFDEGIRITSEWYRKMFGSVDCKAL